MKAAMLYSRMTREGYIPSVSLRIRLHIVKLAELSVPEDQLLDTIGEAFGQDGYDEPALRDLLHLLVEGLQASPQFIRQVVDRFLQTRTPDYTLSAETTVNLVRISQAGEDEESVKHWTAYPSSSEPPAPEQSHSKFPSSPYTTLLRDLASSKPSFEVYKWALERMRADNVQPDVAFFNALLAYEARQRNYEVVFTIYRMLMEKRSSSVKPTAHTFATIFRVIHRLSCSHRYRRTHHIRIPQGAPSARSVFRDLLICHHEYTNGVPNKPSPALEPIVLHKALRTLIARADYAGAFTAIRAFHLFPRAVGRPTLATYRIVFGGLLGRIRAEFPDLAARMASELDPDSLWSFRFLGMTDIPPHRRGGAVALDLGMVHRVLLVGAEPRLNLRFMLAPDYSKPDGAEDGADAELQRIERICDPDEFHSLGMPAPIELTGLKPVPDNSTYARVPLERVLRRAAAASLSAPDDALAKQVSEAIVEAKNEMVPTVEK